MSMMVYGHTVRNSILELFKELLNEGETYTIRKRTFKELTSVGFSTETISFDFEDLIINKAHVWTDRLAQQLYNVVCELERGPTRQAYISFWSPVSDNMLIGKVKGGAEGAPCFLGFHLLNRDGKLSMIVYLRSSDATKFAWDILYHLNLLRFIAKDINAETGTFTVITGSLHVYTKDVRKIEELLK